MHLIGAHRRVELIPVTTLLHPLRVVPSVAVDVENHAARRGSMLGKKGERIRLEHDVAVWPANLKLVVRALPDMRNENLPDARRDHLSASHGRGRPND